MKTKIQVKPLNSSEECKDIANILLKMYENWARINDFPIKTEQNNVLIVDGSLDIAKENGKHRFTRISPFDTQKRRHTSFIQVIINDEQSLSDESFRTYVSHPYKRAKDNKTGKETSDLEFVLDGNIQILW